MFCAARIPYRNYTISFDSEGGRKHPVSQGSSDLHNLVGLKILTVVTNPYATHGGTTRRLDSGASVFNNYAPLDGNADSGSG